MLVKLTTGSWHPSTATRSTPIKNWLLKELLTSLEAFSSLFQWQVLSPGKICITFYDIVMALNVINSSYKPVLSYLTYFYYFNGDCFALKRAQDFFVTKLRLFEFGYDYFS